MLLPKNNNILDGLAVATTVCIGDSALFFYKKRSKRKCCDLGATSWWDMMVYRLDHYDDSRKGTTAAAG